jgi:hypothetical protein
MNPDFSFKSFKKLFIPVYLILTSLIILWPVFYNGYPLFYSDSALYILVSNLFGHLEHTESLPSLSGIGYALFMRIVAWRSTMYLVVFAQALILNILIYLIIKSFSSNSKILKFHLPIIIILSFLSSMGWTTSQLMPDIFTSFLILSVFLFYDSGQKGPAMYLFLSLIVIFSILSHLSNISISIAITGFLLLAVLLTRPGKVVLSHFAKKSLTITTLICVSLLILVGLNKRYYNFAGLSPTSHIFFMARLMDTGFMPEFLEKKCAVKNYEMCMYKDSLPNSYEGFLWDANSPFYKTGGWDFQKSNKKYGEIITDVLTTPKYLEKFLYNCGVHSLKQLKTFEIGEGFSSSFTEQTTPYQTALRHFNKKELKENFLNSRQTRGKLFFDIPNKANYILLYISFFVIVLTFILCRFDKKIAILTLIIISGVIFNAVCTSSLSSVFNRFQSRVMWLIPFLACIYFCFYLLPRFHNIFSNVMKKSTNKS